MTDRINNLLEKYEVILGTCLLKKQLQHIKKCLINNYPSLEKDLYYTKLINKAEDVLRRINRRN